MCREESCIPFFGSYEYRSGKNSGVREIIMVTPPGKDGKVTPTTLVAAKEAGADKIYKVGGAQAIAALAYGTESISKVDKIVGPGNIYVALAKKAVYGHVSIDSIAGPSEILVLADETANPRYVAADLLSQAEHDEMASAILVTVSMELAEKVSEQTELFISQLSRERLSENLSIITDIFSWRIQWMRRLTPQMKLHQSTLKS